MISSNCIEVTYVLELTGDNWYIGKTTQLHKRLTSHFNGKGAAWTQLHAPFAVCRVYEGNREKEMYLYAANKYGKDSVRGWAYTKTK